MDLRALWRCCVPITGPPTCAPPALIVLFSPFCGTTLLPLCAHLFHWAYKKLHVVRCQESTLPVP